MALGFTSHFSKSDQPFGSLILSNTETETSGSVASDTGNSFGICTMYNGGEYDCCDFSVSVNIDYSQYANFVASGSTETAGSVAYSGSGVSTASTVSFSGGSVSCSSGCSTSFTC